MFARLLAAVAALSLAFPLHAADEDKPAAAQGDYTPLSATKRFTGTYGGQKVTYSATMAEQVLKDEAGKPLAAIVTTSFIAEPRDSRRPVTFLFNGGPGAGSLWLQMGAFGPKRVAVPGNAQDDGAPPYPLLDNPDALLDVTDLVFIDPVGTGFSHTIGETKGEDYWGLEKDAKSVAAVIRKWLADNDRWSSPKFVGGESYGTTRAVAVTRELEGGVSDVGLNGVLLISTVLDFGAGADVPGNELSYITNVPSMAVTAWHHGKVEGASAEAVAAEARAFAIGAYASALLKGQRLGAEERAQVRRELARLTGLSETYIEQADLRVSDTRFYKELLRDRGLTVGRLDSRYTGRDYDNAGEGPDADPSLYGIDAGYTAAMNIYARETLGFRPERDYQSISDIFAKWDWKLSGGRDTNAYLNVTPWLGQAMRENSGLRVLVAQGYYDFATPFFAAEYALTRTGVPQDRVTWHYYDSGHMMYVRAEDRAKLSADVRAFIRNR